MYYDMSASVLWLYVFIYFCVLSVYDMLCVHVCEVMYVGVVCMYVCLVCEHICDVMYVGALRMYACMRCIYELMLVLYLCLYVLYAIYVCFVFVYAMYVSLHEI